MEKIPFRFQKFLFCVYGIFYKENIEKMQIAEPSDVEEQSPMARANFISRITWNWMTKIVNIGVSQPLEMNHLPTLGKADSAHFLFNRALEEWIPRGKNLPLEKIDTKPIYKEKIQEIVPLLKNGFLKVFLVNGLMELMYMALQIASSIFLKELILFLAGSNGNEGKAYMYAGLLGISAILQGVFHHGYGFGANRIGAHIRTLINVAIFEKLLRLKQSALINTTTGQIINLVTNDSFKLEITATYLFFLFGAPIVGIVAIYLLYMQLGVAAFPASATIFLMVPLQSFFSGRFAKIRKNTMDFTDQRVKIIKEILVGSQIVKMYNW
jgi:ABC-type bacteriocin/lantibiotic exporter with double-glycine peptidase domain